MFWTRFFRKRSTVVERIEQYVNPTTIEHITIHVPATVDAMLLADRFERELKRRDIA